MKYTWPEGKRQLFFGSVSVISSYLIDVVNVVNNRVVRNARTEILRYN